MLDHVYQTFTENEWEAQKKVEDPEFADKCGA